MATDRYYKVFVHHRNVALELNLVTITGDPDIFVCNRNAFPTQTQVLRMQRMHRSVCCLRAPCHMAPWAPAHCIQPPASIRRRRRQLSPTPNPTQHTWKSAGVGDDTVLIRPNDPLFYPGPFYIRRARALRT